MFSLSCSSDPLYRCRLPFRPFGCRSDTEKQMMHTRHLSRSTCVGLVYNTKRLRILPAILSFPHHTYVIRQLHQLPRHCQLGIRSAASYPMTPSPASTFSFRAVIYPSTMSSVLISFPCRQLNNVIFHLQPSETRVFTFTIQNFSKWLHNRVLVCCVFCLLILCCIVCDFFFVCFGWFLTVSVTQPKAQP